MDTKQHAVLTFDLKPSMRSIDDNGYMHVKLTPISKETVNPYYGYEIPNHDELGLEPERIYYVYRPGKELAKAAATFNGLPLLLEHHMDSADNPQKEYRIGSTGTDGVFKAPYLMQSLSITDEKAIQAVEDGSYRELSCSYWYEPVLQPGTYNGVDYDLMMKNIKGSHVALVNEGRAGHDVAVADAKPNNMKGETKMADRKKTTTKKANDDGLNPVVQPTDFESLMKALAMMTGECDGFDDAIGTGDLVNGLFTSMDDAGKAQVSALLDKVRNKMNEAQQAQPVQAGEGTAAVVAGDEPLQPAAPKPAEPAHGTNHVPAETQPETQTTPEPEHPEPPSHAQDAKPKKGATTVNQPVIDANVIKEEVRQELTQKFRALNQAANDCKPFIGIVDPLAFDSADEIYKEALKQKGIATDSYPTTAFKGMVDMMKLTQTQTMAAAQDAMPVKQEDPALEKAFANIGRISHE